MSNMNEMTESEYLQMHDDGGASDEFTINSAEQWAKDLPKQIEYMRSVYLQSKSAKVGQQVKCPTCNTTFTKTSYQQAFCCNAKTVKKGQPNCKDQFWNFVDDGRRQRMLAMTRDPQLDDRYDGDEYESAGLLARDIRRDAMSDNHGSFNAKQALTQQNKKAKLLEFINKQPDNVIDTLYALLMK